MVDTTLNFAILGLSHCYPEGLKRAEIALRVDGIAFNTLVTEETLAFLLPHKPLDP